MYQWIWALHENKYRARGAFTWRAQAARLARTCDPQHHTIMHALNYEYSHEIRLRLAT
jgi:hypothetical protein